MSNLSDILAQSGTTDANNPLPGRTLTPTPGSQVEEGVTKAMNSSRPKTMGKHKSLTSSEGDVDSKYTLTLPQLGGWTFFLVSNKPDKNTNCPTTIYPVEFGPGSTGFDDDGLADAIFNNDDACTLMERGELVLTQKHIRTFKHDTGFVLADVFDSLTGERIEGSPVAKLDPRTLRTRYVESDIRTALEGGHQVKVGVKGQAYGKQASPASLKGNQLLGDFT